MCYIVVRKQLALISVSEYMLILYALKMWCVMQMIIPSVIWIWIFTIFSQIYERQFNFSSVMSVWGECNPHSPYVTLKAGPKTHGRHPTPHWAYLLVMATLLNHRLSNFENQLVCCSFVMKFQLHHTNILHTAHILQDQGPLSGPGS